MASINCSQSGNGLAVVAMNNTSLSSTILTLVDKIEDLQREIRTRSAKLEQCQGNF